jgi:hypothetical protein
LPRLHRLLLLQGLQWLLTQLLLLLQRVQALLLLLVVSLALLLLLLVRECQVHHRTTSRQCAPWNCQV